MIPSEEKMQQRLQMLLNGLDNPQKLPRSLGESGLPSSTWYLGPTRVSPKRHFDRFSRFHRDHERDQHTVTHTHTHTQADHATPSVATGRLLQCGLIISRYHSHRLLQEISLTNLANDRTRMTTYLCVYNVETSRTTMY